MVLLGGRLIGPGRGSVPWWQNTYLTCSVLGLILNTKRKEEKKKGRKEGGREREGYRQIPEFTPAASLERSTPERTATGTRGLKYRIQRSKARQDRWPLAGKATSAVLGHQMY